MTTPPILCPVCQTGPLDPPKACEFCPASVLEAMEAIAREIVQEDERLAAPTQEPERVPVPTRT